MDPAGAPAAAVALDPQQAASRVIAFFSAQYYLLHKKISGCEVKHDFFDVVRALACNFLYIGALVTAYLGDLNNCPNKGIEHTLYNEYITNFANPRNPDRLFIVEKDILAVHVVRAANAFFTGISRYIIDKGSLIGCLTPNSLSAAGWYDNATCKNTGDVIYNAAVVALTKAEGDLLELDSIEGSLVGDNIAHIKLRNSDRSVCTEWEGGQNFASGPDGNCRPEVKKYSEAIRLISTNANIRTELHGCFPHPPRGAAAGPVVEGVCAARARGGGGQRRTSLQLHGGLRPLNVIDRRVMSKCDGKRGGDSMQAKGVLMNDIFLTNDRMAAVKAAMLGKRVILTYQKGGEFYVEFIKPNDNIVVSLQSYKNKRVVLNGKERAIRQFYNNFAILLQALKTANEKAEEITRARNNHSAAVAAAGPSAAAARAVDRANADGRGLIDTLLLPAREGGIHSKFEEIKRNKKNAEKNTQDLEQDPQYQSVKELYDLLHTFRADIIHKIDPGYILPRDAEVQEAPIEDPEKREDNPRVKRQKTRMTTEGGAPLDPVDINPLIYRYIDMIKTTLPEKRKKMSIIDLQNDMSNIYLSFLENEISKQEGKRNMRTILYYIELLLPIVCNDDYFKSFNEPITTLRGMFVLHYILRISDFGKCKVPSSVCDFVRSYINDSKEKIDTHIQRYTTEKKNLQEKLHDKLHTIEDKINFLETCKILRNVSTYNYKGLPSYEFLKNIYDRHIVFHYNYLLSIRTNQGGGARPSGFTAVDISTHPIAVRGVSSYKKDEINDRSFIVQKPQEQEHSIEQQIQKEVYAYIQKLNEETILEQSFLVKKFIAEQPSEILPIKETLLKGIFMKFYGTGTHTDDTIRMMNINEKALRSVMPITSYGTINGTDKHIQRAYTIFRNSIHIFPEYLDVLTLTSIIYSTDRTPLYPPHLQAKLDQLQKDIKENKPLPKPESILEKRKL